MNSDYCIPYGTLGELYRASVEKYAGHTSHSMYESDESLTYREFAARVDEVIQLLKCSGLRSGDKVAILSSNMPNWPVCYFATVISGLVVVPVMSDFSGHELDMIIGHSDAKALFVSDKLYSKVSKTVTDSMNVVVRTKNLAVISQNVSSEGSFSEPHPDDIAAIIYTSGTTSTPKGVMLTHGNLTSQIAMENELFPVNEDDVFLSVLPLSHTYECSVGMLLPFMVGASVVYLDRLPSASKLLPALREVRPTIMLIVPLIIEKIYKSNISSRFQKSGFTEWLYSLGFLRKPLHMIIGGKLKKMFGGRLRFLGIGGAKLDSETERFLRESGFPYAIGYGLTETAPLIAGAIPGNVPFRSTGPVLKGIKARIDNVNPATGEGEIVVLSPSTMKGYYKNEEATSEVFTDDGWFRTKDLGCFDDSGNLYIKGRLGSMIVGPSGENIYPEEIESVITSHFLVSDAIVTERQGRLVALVHFNKDALEQRYFDLKDGFGQKMEDIKADIKRYVNSKVARFSYITEVEERSEEFEKTPTQKIKRFLYNRKNIKQPESNGDNNVEAGADEREKYR